MDEFLTYYTAELAFLREMGAEFARRYPKVAGRLLLGPDACEDPHVERLLEGVAFLTARVRRKIDDEFPEITDAFFQVLFPHYQRPVPSMSVVQLTPGPDPTALAGGVTLERGARLLSAEVNGVRCAYRTTYPVTLWPVKVESARLQPDCVGISGSPRGAAAVIRLRLRCGEGLKFGQLPLGDPSLRLRFYLDGAPASVYGLYESLFNHVCGVFVRDLGDPHPGEERAVAGGLSLIPVGFGRDDGMFPYPENAPAGYRLLQEYFAFPEKFLFADVVGWKSLDALGLGESIELLFFLDLEPPPAVKVNDQTFLLGCTPVVNLNALVAEPIRLDQTRSEYRVVPSVEQPWAHEVYSIDAVTSVGSYFGNEVDFDPFYSLGHARGTSGGPASAYWYATRRQPEAGTDAGTEVYLTFVNTDFQPCRPASEVVSVRATCTNRDVPSRLAFGGNQGGFTLQTVSAVGRIARCLRKPTPSLRPKTGRGAHRRLISHLALNHLTLDGSERGTEALRETLRLYDLADDAATRQQLAGVRSVSSRSVAGRIKTGACLGTEVTVEFDEDRFVGSGLFLFASVLERFLGAYAAINSFSRLVAMTSREGLLKRWPPRTGDRALL